MAEPTRGLLDTSVVFDHDVIDHALLPDESAIAAVTLAELAAGPHATEDKGSRDRTERIRFLNQKYDRILLVPRKTG